MNIYTTHFYTFWFPFWKSLLDLASHNLRNKNTSLVGRYTCSIKHIERVLYSEIFYSFYFITGYYKQAFRYCWNYLFTKKNLFFSKYAYCLYSQTCEQRAHKGDTIIDKWSLFGGFLFYLINKVFLKCVAFIYKVVFIQGWLLKQV